MVETEETFDQSPGGQRPPSKARVRDSVHPVRGGLAVDAHVRAARQFSSSVEGRGRPFWIFDWADGIQFKRVACEGDRCPKCRVGTTTYFVPPEDCDEVLACNSFRCGFGWPLVSNNTPALSAQKFWHDLPLVATPRSGSRKVRLAANHHALEAARKYEATLVGRGTNLRYSSHRSLEVVPPNSSKRRLPGGSRNEEVAPNQPVGAVVSPSKRKRGSD